VHFLAFLVVLAQNRLWVASLACFSCQPLLGPHRDVSGDSGRKGWRADPQHYLIALPVGGRAIRSRPAARWGGRDLAFKDYLLVTVYSRCLLSIV
jgi:hypothetical protein